MAMNLGVVEFSPLPLTAVSLVAGSAEARDFARSSSSASNDLEEACAEGGEWAAASPPTGWRWLNAAWARPLLLTLAVAAAALGLTVLAPTALARSASLSADIESKSLVHASPELSEDDSSSCHTASEGETCYKAVKYGMEVGWQAHPKWYPGLDGESSFEDFQAHLYSIPGGGCPRPCNWRKPTLVQPPAAGSPCLCLFDADRTLTARQDTSPRQCPGELHKPGVYDNAFSGGDLHISELGQHIGDTFCGKCHLGIVSAGSAGGFEEKAVLQSLLKGASEVPALWSAPGGIVSPLVIGCGNDVKATCAKGIVDWYKAQRNVEIPPHEVYFFDDLTGNTRGFADYGFNARQISCSSREGPLGLCGGQAWEVVRQPGVFNC